MCNLITSILIFQMNMSNSEFLLCCKRLASYARLPFGEESDVTPTIAV